MTTGFIASLSVLVVFNALSLSARAQTPAPQPAATGAKPAVTTPTQDKVVCTMTFNSSNEKRLFKKYLKGFKFKELVPQENVENDWLESTCRPSLQCDILIISSHFDGDFFGENGGAWASGDEMESVACRPGCKGVFEKPKEVFLFGCNTLSGAQSKMSEMNHYVKSLVAQGTDLKTAQAMADRKFPPTGNSFFDRMRRIFRTQKVYGFNDLAPSGSTIQPFLEAYLKSIPSYHDHIDQLSPEPNKALARALTDMAFVETWGMSPRYQNPMCR